MYFFLIAQNKNVNFIFLFLRNRGLIFRKCEEFTENYIKVRDIGQTVGGPTLDRTHPRKTTPRPGQTQERKYTSENARQ